MNESKTAKKIDWTDPSVIRYHTQKMKPERTVAKQTEICQNLKVKATVSYKRNVPGEKEPGAKRKKSIPRKTTRKRQKLEEDAEKDELKGFLDIVPREEAPIEIESISIKFPIMDWKTYVLTKTFMYGYVKDRKKTVKNGLRDRMSVHEAKEKKSKRSQRVNASDFHNQGDTYWNWMSAMVSRVLELKVGSEYRLD
ncbi:hypothetical protein Tco_0227616 [Tanacetum coccineum]